jgi:tetratricopeptide (TPR) repeat protein
MSICKHFFLVLYFLLFVLVQALPAQTQTAESYLKQGREKMAKKEYKRAVTDFSIALEIEPSVEAYFLRATAKYMLDNVQEALTDYDNALSLDPYNAVIYNSRGNVKDELKRTVEAMKDYNKAISLDSNYTNAYYNRAIAHYNVQEFKESQADFSRVLLKTPQDAEAMIGIGLCLVKMNKVDEACAWFAKARQLQPALAEEYLKKLCQ